MTATVRDGFFLPGLTALQERFARVVALPAVALLQATSLPFLVTAAQIGVEIGLMSSVTAAALTCAGLLSVLVFPTTAVGLLRSRAAVPA